MRKYLVFLCALFVLSACNEELEKNQPHSNGKMEFGTNVSFLKLEDDSTDIAGALEITANTANVELKWNVAPECNLDTTVTKIELSNGKYTLPIKWAKRMDDGSYGPVNNAYSAGVQIISGDFIKYVPLVWADEFDSVKIAKNTQVVTRAEASTVRAVEVLTITPSLLELDKDTCGSVKVHYTGGRFYYDDSDIQEILIEMGDIFHLEYDLPGSNHTDGTLDFNWKAGIAPTDSFITHIRVDCPGQIPIIKYMYLRYDPPKDTEFRFINSIPDVKESLPAKGAYVIVNVFSNGKWTLESPSANPKKVNSTEGSAGNQSLVLKIEDNLDPINKTIYVTYADLGIDHITGTLEFTQEPAAGTFEILDIDPAEDKELSADKQLINVTVKTNQIWWIRWENAEKIVPADTNSGTLEIPPYAGTEPRILYVQIGHGNVLERTVKYSQKVYGEEDLTYDSSNLDATIPKEGAEYLFKFSGNFTGAIQMRATLENGTALALGGTSYDKNATVRIPSNTQSIKKREIKFQYRLNSGEWTDLLIAAKGDASRQQEAASITTAILPTGNIPYTGGQYSCAFGGTYVGSIKLIAIRENIVLDSKNGQCPGSTEVTIDDLGGSADKTVYFKYVVGTDTVDISSRVQNVASVRFATITPEGIIPAGGGNYSSQASGTYSDDVYFRARVGNTVIATPKLAKLPYIFTLAIPANKGNVARTVVFEYSLTGIADDSWNEVQSIVQASDVKVDSGDVNVGDFGNGEGQDVGVDI